MQFRTCGVGASSITGDAFRLGLANASAGYGSDFDMAITLCLEIFRENCQSFVGATPPRRCRHGRLRVAHREQAIGSQIRSYRVLPIGERPAKKSLPLLLLSPTMQIMMAARRRVDGLKLSAVETMIYLERRSHFDAMKKRV